MKQKNVYLFLCFLGIILPMYQFVPWLIEHGINLPLFFNELFSTSIGAFFGLDVIVSALVLFVFIFYDGSRLKVKKLWVPVVATMSVGVSLGLPLYLLMREQHISE